MVVIVKAATFSFISSVYIALWPGQTPLSKMAANVYECGLACESYSQCGGFSWDQSRTVKCLVISVQETIGSITENVYRKATIRNKRIVDLQEGRQLKYSDHVAICDGISAQVPPVPVNSLERIILAIRPGNLMYLNGSLTANAMIDTRGGSGINGTHDFFSWTEENPAEGQMIIVDGINFRTGNEDDRRNVNLMCIQNLM